MFISYLPLCSNDALRKYGIIPPKEPTPPSPSPPPSPKLEDVLNDFNLNELQELSEDAPDDETERFIAQYRLQRIADEKKEQRRARFGRIYPIGREDYTREVTEASKLDEDDDEEEKGTGVICFLYKDGYMLIFPPWRLIAHDLHQSTKERPRFPAHAHPSTTLCTDKICVHRREQVHPRPPRLESADDYHI